MADAPNTVPVRPHGIPGRSSLRWAFALLGGLVVWMVRLLVGWGLVGFACQAGWVGIAVLLGVSAAGIAVTVAALLTARGIQRAVAAGDDYADGLVFVAGVGLLMNATALLLIVFESSFILFLDPCASA